MRQAFNALAFRFVRSWLCARSSFHVSTDLAHFSSVRFVLSCFPSESSCSRACIPCSCRDIRARGKCSLYMVMFSIRIPPIFLSLTVFDFFYRFRLDFCRLVSAVVFCDQPSPWHPHKLVDDFGAIDDLAVHAVHAPIHGDPSRRWSDTCQAPDLRHTTVFRRFLCMTADRLFQKIRDFLKHLSVF